MTDKYMLVLRLIGSHGYTTGDGVITEWNKEHQDLFDSIPSAGIYKADFCIIVCDGDSNEVLDSAFIGSETFKNITGNDVLSDEEYIEKGVMI